MERVLGPEDPWTLTGGAGLAGCTGERGCRRACEQYAALLPIFERVLGSGHPETMIVRANLAAWTGEAGDDVDTGAH